MPRLFYVEWVVHFHQKHVISALDYPAWRPRAPALAPFFFCMYLPQMGVHVPGVQPPNPSWPDIDWPQIDWPSLEAPKVKMADLLILLRVRFPRRGRGFLGGSLRPRPRRVSVSRAPGGTP